MTEPDSNTPSTAENCANCDAPLTGEYCANCAQSRADIQRRFWPLITDALDGLLDWDGRFMTTVRELFSRPGRVAHDYMRGKRNRYTTPVRLYLIVSLMFFAAISISEVRIIAIETSMTETGPGITVQMFQLGTTPEPLELTQQQLDDYAEGAPETGLSRRFSDMALAAALDPEKVEGEITSIASQAQILMVIIFALINLMLHPKGRLIEHLVYALYFHAAALPLIAILIISGTHMPEIIPLAITVAILAWLGFSAFIWAHDRGFYGSSWWGAILRSQALMILYFFATLFLALGMIFLVVI